MPSAEDGSSLGLLGRLMLHCLGEVDVGRPFAGSLDLLAQSYQPAVAQQLPKKRLPLKICLLPIIRLRRPSTELGDRPCRALPYAPAQGPDFGTRRGAGLPRSYSAGDHEVHILVASQRGRLT